MCLGNDNQFKMKVVAFLICFLISETLSQTDVHCDFNAARRSFCRWKREWFGMRKAGWKTGNTVRRFSLEDQNFENGLSKFNKIKIANS